MKYLFFSFLLSLSLLACKQDAKPPEQTTATATAASKATVLPGLSKEDIIKLYETAEHIDYIFFNWDFSMNQSEPNAVKAAVTFISDQGPQSITDCKAIGRVVFLAQGEILREADMSYSEGCYYYTFVNESNRPQYHNAMTDQGISFYAKMFQQALAPAQSGQ